MSTAELFTKLNITDIIIIFYYRRHHHHIELAPFNRAAQDCMKLLQRKTTSIVNYRGYREYREYRELS